MNMKRLFAIALALCLVLGLCACGETNNDETTTEETTTEATTTAETTEETTEAQTGVTYTVKVVDEGGNPIAAAMVQICQGESCNPRATDDTGTAVWENVEEADYEVKFLALPTGYDYTTAEQVFHFADGSYELTLTLKAVA